MNGARRWIVVLLVVGSAGCGSSVQMAPNTERAAITWKPKEGSDKLCLEYATAAAKLKDREANITLAIPDTADATVKFRSAESLAQIYTVGEIMQFGHVALYRLCEANANEFFDHDKYQKLFERTLRSIEDLVRLQLELAQGSTTQRLEAKRAKLDWIDSQLAALDDKEDAASLDRAEELRGRRAELLRDIERIVEAYGPLPEVESTETPVETTP